MYPETVSDGAYRGDERETNKSEEHSEIQKAGKGENCVVVAPTGSGKTIVAAHIMRAHVQKQIEQKKPYRVSWS